MAAPTLKKLCNTLKHVDKTCCNGLLRAAGGHSSVRARPLGLSDWPKSTLRTVSMSGSSNQSSLCNKHNLNLLQRFTAMESKVQELKGRDFMNLSGLSNSPNLTPAVDSSATFYFDTHKLVTTLQSHGFSLDQAETITDCLTEILTSGASGMSRYMVRSHPHRFVFPSFPDTPSSLIDSIHLLLVFLQLVGQ